MLCTARAWQLPGSRSPQLGISVLYTRSQTQTRTSAGWLAHAKKGEGNVQGMNGGRQGCHDRPRGDSPQPGCPFPLAAG